MWAARQQATTVCRLWATGLLRSILLAKTHIHSAGQHTLPHTRHPVLPRAWLYRVFAAQGYRAHPCRNFLHKAKNSVLGRILLLPCPLLLLFFYNGRLIAVFLSAGRQKKGLCCMA